MNKDRLCERSEPRSYPVVEQARCRLWSLYKKISFLGYGIGRGSSRSVFFSRRTSALTYE